MKIKCTQVAPGHYPHQVAVLKEWPRLKERKVKIKQIEGNHFELITKTKKKSIWTHSPTQVLQVINHPATEVANTGWVTFRVGNQTISFYFSNEPVTICERR